MKIEEVKFSTRPDGDVFLSVIVRDDKGGKLVGNSGAIGKTEVARMVAYLFSRIKDTGESVSFDPATDKIPQTLDASWHIN